ncbi:Two-component sensor histidine kinase, contains HisKA and HATPase domains [Rhizobium sp. RU20A]|uniref:sensor histidine kinase n=1 Tax=Rhizobium sp. RU20A TaxID=1907412 RepID=UPI000953E669|nr:sensor histidine kinase [Rhizobium sp. RU20A]SIQ31191.1 Two-component sensor histidine kinase, contains HisKA and HATPase domains [Rhizobium sp. RU20A]
MRQTVTQAADGTETADNEHPVERVLRTVLARSGTAFRFQRDDGGLITAHNLSGPLASLTEEFGDARLLFQAEAGESFRSALGATLPGTDPRSLELDMAASDGTRSYRVDLEWLEAGDHKGVLLVFTDISDTRHREKVLKTLLRELSHRSKNLMAIIQGIATQTARQAQSLEIFLTQFRGRLHSLSRSQDLVTDSSWRGADLFELVDQQMTAYAGDASTVLRRDGRDIRLSPNAALHVGLALHELIVNSASEGALAAGTPPVRLSTRPSTLRDLPAMDIVWHEERGKAEGADVAEARGFARTVLERVVPTAVGGTATYGADSDLVEYRLTIPGNEYEELPG